MRVHGRLGADGYLMNVRSTMKRIRKKFLALDPAFAEIENFAAIGYAWRKARRRPAVGGAVGIKSPLWPELMQRMALLRD